MGALSIISESKMEPIWKKIKEKMEETLEKNVYKIWIKPLKCLDSTETTLCLGCRNQFHKTWIQNNFLEEIEKIFSDLGLEKIDLQLEVVEEREILTPPQEETSQMKLPHISREGREGRFLNKNFTFENFVVGDTNEVPFTLVKAFADKDKAAVNILLLRGNTGVGKTHLLQALANEVFENQQPRTAFYLTVEDFMNEMVSALRRGEIQAFKSKYRERCDLLILDEIQFLGGKIKTQEEFGFTLDTLLDAGKSAVFSTSISLEQVKGMKKSLVSRIYSGAVITVEGPDLEMRQEIVRRKQGQRNLILSEDFIHCIAERTTQDVRILEGVLDSLGMIRSVAKRDITLEIVKKVLEWFAPEGAITISEKEIQNIVSQYYQVDIESLLSKSRKASINYPRAIAIFLCRKYTNTSLEGLGRIFN